MGNGSRFSAADARVVEAAIKAQAAADAAVADALIAARRWPRSDPAALTPGGVRLLTWEAKLELRPRTARSRAHVHRPAVPFDDLAYDREPDADAA